MKNILYTLISLGIFLGISCTKDVPLPASTQERKIIAGMILRPGEPLKAKLSIANAPKWGHVDLELYNEAIGNSEIRVFKNDQYHTSLWFDSSTFQHQASNHLAEIGATYHFTIDMPQVKLAASSPKITVPEPIIPTEISVINTHSQRWIELSLPKDPSNPYILLHFSFILENSNVENMPINEVGLTPYTNNADWLGISQPNPADYNFSNVPLYAYFEHQQINYTDSTAAAFDVAGFAINTNEANGNNVKIKIRFMPEQFAALNYYKKLRVQTVSVNKDYLDYLISAKQYEQSVNNPFSSPAQVYSNIIGGMGIFGAITKTEVLVDL